MWLLCLQGNVYIIIFLLLLPLQRLQEEITKMSPSLERNAMYLKSVSIFLLISFSIWKVYPCLLLNLKNSEISFLFLQLVKTQPSACLLDCSNGQIFLQREGVCQCKSPQGLSWVTKLGGTVVTIVVIWTILYCLFILKDVKFPLMLDVYELCTTELQEKMLPIRSKFKDVEDKKLEKQQQKVKSIYGWQKIFNFCFFNLHFSHFFC